MTGGLREPFRRSAAITLRVKRILGSRFCPCIGLSRSECHDCSANTNTPGVTYHLVRPPGAQQPAGGVWESEGKFPNYAIF